VLPLLLPPLHLSTSHGSSTATEYAQYILIEGRQWHWPVPWPSCHLWPSNWERRYVVCWPVRSSQPDSNYPTSLLSWYGRGTVTIGAVLHSTGTRSSRRECPSAPTRRHALCQDFGSAKKRGVLKSQAANRVDVSTVVGSTGGTSSSTGPEALSTTAL
jgi:hypothetical protein